MEAFIALMGTMITTKNISESHWEIDKNNSVRNFIYDIIQGSIKKRSFQMMILCSYFMSTLL